MNSRPMILRFSSGSVTPASASRNCSRASTTCRSTPVAATKSRSTCSVSPSRSSPWSTNTQVSWSPMARCTSAAATAESTPPDSPQIARPSPTCARIALDLLVDDVGRSSRSARGRRCRTGSARAPSGRARCAAPRGGTARRPAGGRRPRTRRPGAPVEVAVTVKPGGAAATASPWLIHTDCSHRQRRRAARPRVVTVSGVPPYSRSPVRATVPPSAAAIAWKP